MHNTHSSPLRHITLFKLYESTDQATKDRVLDELRSIGIDDPRVLEWKVEVSLDTRKGHVIVENGLFRSQQDFEAWRKSDKHQKVAAFIQTTADWWIGDYLEK